MKAIDYVAECEAARGNGAMGVRERVELDAGIFAGLPADVIAYDVGVSTATVMRRRRYLRKLGCTFPIPEAENTEINRESIRKNASYIRKSSSEKQPTRAA